MKRGLQKRGENMHKFLDIVGIILLACDASQKITFINRKGCEIVGCRKEEIEGKNLFDISFFDRVGKEEKKAFKKAMGKRTKLAEWNHEGRVLTKDGEEKTISWHCTALKDEAGNVSGVLISGEDITEHKQAEQIQSILYKIANAANTTKDLNDLFKSIQNHLGMVVDTTNFYIALYEKETDTISIPHLVDERDTFTSFPAGKSLSAFVIKRGKPILLTWEKIEKLIKKGELEQVGAPSKVWLGVPLKMGKEVIGVVAVQSYTDVSLYTKKDSEILEFVSGQIAVAIERKRAEEALKKSKNKIEQLHAVAAKMEAAQTEDEVCHLAIDAAGRILDFSIASIQYVEDDYLKIKITTEENVSEDYRMSINEGIGGKTYRTKKSYLVGDMTKDKDAKSTDDTYRSVISVPIGDYGVFQTHSNRVGQFTNEDLELAELLMSHVNEALKRIKSEEALKESKNKIEQLHRISARMEATQTEGEVYCLAIEAAERILRFAICDVSIVEGDWFVVKCASSNQPVGTSRNMPLNEGIIGETYRTGKSYLIKDMREVEKAKPVHSELRSLLSIPIGNVGVFQAASVQVNAFDEEDLKLAELLMFHVTEAFKRIQNQKAIRDSEERYRTLFDNIADPVMVFDQETHLIVDCNSSFIKRYGYALDELRQMTPYHLHPPEDFKTVQENIDDKENIGPHTYTHITKGGEKFPVEVFTQELEYKGKKSWISIMRDITERKRAENRQAVAYKIADAANRATNLDELFGYIRDELGHVIDTTNFYIALYNTSNNEVTFPYYIDEKDSPEVIQTLHREYGEGLTEFIIENGKAALFYEDDLKQRKSIGFLARTWLGVPLITRGNTIGVMAVQSYSDPHAYTQEDLEFMEFVSSQIAIVIERKRSEDKLSTIYDLSRDISSSLDLDKILEKVLEACEKVLDFKMISICPIDEEKGEIYIKAQRGYPEELKNLRLPLEGERGVTIWVAKHGESIIVPDVSQDPRFVRGDPKVTTKSELTVPLKVGERTIGVINVESEKLYGFLEDDRRLLETLAGQVAVAMENAQLFEQTKQEIAKREKVEGKLAAIYDVSREITLTFDLDKILEKVMDACEKILDFKNIALFLMHEEKHELYIKSPRGIPEEAKNFRLSLREDIGITVWVAKHGESLIVPDVLKDLRYIRGDPKGKSQSELAVPLKAGEKVIGVLNAESENLDAFSEDDRRLLETLAGQAAVAIQNAQLFGQAQNEITQRKKAEEKLGAIHKMAEKLALSLDVDGIANTALEIAQDVLEFKNCAIALVDKEKQELYIKAQTGFPENLELLKIPLKGKGITAWVANNGQSLLVPDVSKEDRYVEWASSIKSELCVPLKVKDETIGIFNVESERPNAFTTEDQMLLETLASEAAIALENARLFKGERDAALQIEFLNDLMSHDINNINQISLGYLELLKNMELAEKQRLFVEKALNSVRTSAQLVENVKKLQKLKGGEIRVERINLKDILLDVISEVSHRVDKNINVEFSPKDVWIPGTPLLKDVFFNLMDNAIKYTPGKEVKVEVSVLEVDDSVRVCVKDWGPGVPDEMKTKIFDRFERISKGVKGSGLGLYIVKMIVGKLYGRIWMEDNPQGGSVFCVELPGVAR